MIDINFNRAAKANKEAFQSVGSSLFDSEIIDSEYDDFIENSYHLMNKENNYVSCNLF